MLVRDVRHVRVACVVECVVECVIYTMSIKDAIHA